MSTPELKTTLDHALYYRHVLGWSVIPLQRRDKRPAGRFLPRICKLPREVHDKDDPGHGSWKTYQNFRACDDEVLDWWKDGSALNLGIVQGAISGAVALDVDGLEGEETLKRFGPLPRSLWQTTGKGWQMLFQHPGFPVRNSQRRLEKMALPGIDFRGDGGYIVAAPSIHPNGKTYIWMESLTTELAPLPEWVMEKLTEVLDEESDTAGDRIGRGDGGDGGRDGGDVDSDGSTVPGVQGVNGTAGGHGLTGVVDSRRRYALAALAGEAAKLMALSDGDKHEPRLKSAHAIGGFVGSGYLSEEEVTAALAVNIGPNRENAMQAIRDGIRAGRLRPREIEPSGYSSGGYVNGIGIVKVDGGGGDPGVVLRGTSDGVVDDGEDVGAAKAQKVAALATQAQAGAIIESIAARPEDPAASLLPGENLSDMGNAHRFVKLFGKDAMYVPGVGGWYAWTGTHWQQDDLRQVRRMTHDTVRSIYREAASCTDGEVRKKVVAHALRSESAGGLRAMLEVAEDLCATSHKDLDTHSFLLNCDNGTIDLRSGIMRAHERGDKITLKISEKFSLDADCPAWKRFLDEIMVGVTPRVAFLSRWAGYILTADTRERKLLLGLGVGQNGKSTFVNQMELLMGPYARRTPADTILARDHNGPTNDLAALRPARLVTITEIEEGRRLNEAMIKDLTGQDSITCRFLHQEFITYRPGFKLVGMSNHRPVVRAGGQALWDRISIIPFEARFEDTAQDRGLGDKLAAEGAGILAWAVRGCMEWQASGLMTPEDVRVATAEYRADSDLLGQFLEENCYLDKEATAPKTALFLAWTRWSEANNVYTGSAMSLTSKMREKGFEDDRDARSRWWIGAGLKI
jgi:putative DNA primase/helicase